MSGLGSLASQKPQKMTTALRVKLPDKNGEGESWPDGITPAKTNSGGDNKGVGEVKKEKVGRKGKKQVKVPRFKQQLTSNNGVRRPNADPGADNVKSSRDTPASNTRKQPPKRDGRIEDMEQKLERKFGLRSSSGRGGGEKKSKGNLGGRGGGRKVNPWDWKVEKGEEGVEVNNLGYDTRKSNAPRKSKRGFDVVVVEGSDDDDDEEGYYDDDDIEYVEEEEGEEEWYDEDDEGYESRDGGRIGGEGAKKAKEGKEENWENELDSIMKEKEGGGGRERGGFLGGGGGKRKGGIFGRRDDVVFSADVADDVEGGSTKHEDDMALVTSGITSNRNNAVKNKIQTLKKRPKPERGEVMKDWKGRKMILNIPYVEKCMIDAKKDDEEESQLGFRVPPPTWSSSGLKSPILQSSLESCGYTAPLPIQSSSYRLITTGTKNVVINAHTGAGKTVAFMAPIIEGIISGSYGANKGVKAIVVVPGRELAAQITDVVGRLVKGMEGCKVGMIIGGTGFDRTVERFRKNRPDIIVGTPGRIAEMIMGKGGKGGGRSKGVIKTGNVGVLVLDEADNLLLSPAHKESTVAIMEAVTDGRKGDVKVVMSSATVRDMKEGYFERWCMGGYEEVGEGGTGRNKKVDVEDEGEGGGNLIDNRRHITSTTLHGVVKVARDQLKLELLRKILNTSPNPTQVLVFVNEARRVGIVCDKLGEMGIIAAPLSGGQNSDKDERVQVAKALRDGRVGCVVSTEIAARGIDAVFLTHVINLDLPTDASHYCHRAGRVGRGGRPGVVVSIASGGKEGGVVGRWGKELGIKVANVEVREGMMGITSVENK